MTGTILLVEDDPSIARGLAMNLGLEGFRAVSAADGEEALRLCQSQRPDLVLLDLMLPKLDGLEVIRRLRAQAEDVPIVVLSAKGDEADKVMALSLGADDYVTKPFALDELLARVHAVLRRTKPPIETLRLGNTLIDFKRLTASNGTKKVELTDREFEILHCLAERAGHVVTRDELLHLVWGYSDAPLTRTVDNFIFRLRHKLEPDPRHPTYIRKAYGDGYRLVIE